MKGLFLLADRHGPGYYRGILPFAEMRKFGHDTRTATAVPTLREAERFDFVTGQRICEMSASVRWQKLAQERPCKLVFDLDDDLWRLDASNEAKTFFTQELQERLRRNIEVSDLVTVSTETLAEVVRPMNSNVVVLPNAVPSWLLDHERPCTDGPVTIGWAGSSTHHRDFGELARPLRRVLQRYPDRCELHVISTHDYTQRVASIKGRTRWTGWVHGVEPYLRALDFDIGVAPLHPSPFNDSKSDLKLLEYSALGIPAVVSNTGPYARAVASGSPARPVVHGKEWEQNLIELIFDEDARAAEAAKARDWVRRRTIGQAVGRWLTTYDLLLRGPQFAHGEP